MSEDILKSINKIKVSINKNDQELWECQASAKCYNQATEKLQQECKRLNKDIERINQEIGELNPQVQTTAECYDVHVESIALNTDSLINQRCYTKYVMESNKKHQEEMDHEVDRYSEYIQMCKEKLKRTNPTYKVLITKKIELKSCKIRCLELQQKIRKWEEIHKQKIEVKRKLFYSDFVAFAKAWVDFNKYSENLRLLKEETAKEREFMQKLAEVSELLKQKQKQAVFKIPQIGFSDKLNDNNRLISERSMKNYCDEGNNLGKNHINSYLSELKTMLEKKDFDMPQTKRPANMSDSQKLEIKAGSSKVRILENKTLEIPQNAPKVLKMQSKEERSKMIDAKLKKAVDNFHKTMSRHNSKQQISLSQKSVQGESNLDTLEKKLSQQSKCSQENNDSAMVVEQNPSIEPYSGSGATQELKKLTISQENNGLNELTKNASQASKNPSQEVNPYFHQNANVSTKMDVDPVKSRPNILKKKVSQEIQFPRTVSFMPLSKPEGGNIPLHTQFTMPTSEFGQRNTQKNAGPKNWKENNFCTTPVKKPRTSGVVEKPQVISADFNSTLLNTGNKEPDDARSATETSVEDSRNIFKMGGFTFGINNQFSQMLNETSDFDEGFKSPDIDQAYQSTPSGPDDNTIIKNATSLFSFGQSSYPFSFM